jgi:hypothetical protein
MQCCVCLEHVSVTEPHIVNTCGCCYHFTCIGQVTLPPCSKCKPSQLDVQPGQFSFDTGQDTSLTMFLLTASQIPLRTASLTPVTRPLLTLQNPLWQLINKLKQKQVVPQAVQTLMSSCITYGVFMCTMLAYALMCLCV